VDLEAEPHSLSALSGTAIVVLYHSAYFLWGCAGCDARSTHSGGRRPEVVGIPAASRNTAALSLSPGGSGGRRARILSHNDEPATPPKPPARRGSNSEASGCMLNALQYGVPAVSEIGETLGLQGRVEGPSAQLA